MVDKATVGNLVARITRLVPGIDSYQEKERLRDIDKQLREQLADMLLRETDRIEAVKGSCARKGNLDPLDDLDRLTRTVKRLADTLRHAAYGWSPVFTQVSIDRQRLKNIYSFDQSLEDTVIAVHTEVESLFTSPISDLSAAITGVERALITLDDMVQERERLLKAE